MPRRSARYSRKMGTVIVLVVVALMVVGVIGMMSAGKSADRRKEALANAPTKFDETFDGTTDPVIYRATAMDPIRAEEVIAAAAERGYKVESSVETNQYMSVITFVKR